VTQVSASQRGFVVPYSVAAIAVIAAISVVGIVYLDRSRNEILALEAELEFAYEASEVTAISVFKSSALSYPWLGQFQTDQFCVHRDENSFLRPWAMDLSDYQALTDRLAVDIDRRQLREQYIKHQRLGGLPRSYDIDGLRTQVNVPGSQNLYMLRQLSGWRDFSEIWDEGVALTEMSGLRHAVV
jgi:hypothetical protein